MISVNYRTRPVSVPGTPAAVQPEARTPSMKQQAAASAPACTEDGVTISPEARAAMARQAAAVDGPAEELPGTPGLPG